MLGLANRFIAVLAADAAARLLAGLLRFALACSFTLLPVGVLGFLGVLTFLRFALLAALLLAILAVGLLGALLRLALGLLIHGALLGAGLLLRFDLGEQVLEGVLHLAHQAGILKGVVGVLLAGLLILILIGFAIARLAVLVIVAVFAGAAFALLFLVVAGHLVVGCRFALFLIGSGLGDGCGLALRIRFARRLSVLIGVLFTGALLILFRRARAVFIRSFGSLLGIAPGILGMLGGLPAAQRIGQHARQGLLEIQAFGEPVAEREKAGCHQNQCAHQINAARHGVGDGLAHVDRLRKFTGAFELDLPDFGRNRRIGLHFAEEHRGGKRVGER